MKAKHAPSRSFVFIFFLCLNKCFCTLEFNSLTLIEIRKYWITMWSNKSTFLLRRFKSFWINQPTNQKNVQIKLFQRLFFYLSWMWLDPFAPLSICQIKRNFRLILHYANRTNITTNKSHVNKERNRNKSGLKFDVKIQQFNLVINKPKFGR